MSGRLDKDEVAVLRQERGPRWWTPIVYAGLLAGLVSTFAIACGLHTLPRNGKGAFIIFGAPGYAPFVALYLIVHVVLYYKQVAAVKKVLGFDPRRQNRAEGVIFDFYELRITRNELIKGYGKDAPRISLGGLSATVKETGTKTDHGDDRRVHITIKGPDTDFVYSMAATGVLGPFATADARRFAALLNYEAGLGPPPKRAQEEVPMMASAAPAPQVHEKCTKVRCMHCRHVQTVPVSQKTFSCEQCRARLTRRAAPVESG